MPLINTSVPNLIQGVSQQPDATRFAGQCEEQENALSSVAEGLKKRPNTRHVGRLLGNAIADDSFVHFINRDDTEKYVVIANSSDNNLYAFNLQTGAQCTINGSSNYNISSGYLNSTSPKNALKALTVADNTFLLNSQQFVLEDTSETSPYEKRALAFVQQGDYEKEYTVTMGRSPWAWVSITIYTNSSTGQIRLGSATLAGGSRGYGLNDVYFEVNGVRYPSTATFDIEGRLDTFTFTGGSTPGFGPYVAYGAVSSYNTWTDGSPPFSQSSYFGQAAHVSGTSVSGRNADASTIAGNIQEAATNVNTNPSPVLGSTNGVNSRSGNNNLRDNFTWTRVGSVISAEWAGASNVDFTISTSDPLGEGIGLTSVYKEVDALSSLPVTAPHGFTVKVSGDPELNQDDYYVKFTTQDGSAFGKGTWSETVGPQTPLGLDNTTMPMRLINTGVNTFTLDTIDYDQRVAGDSTSNPAPSFVGKRINNLMFFKNRLGILTDDSVVFSEADHYFNFYRTTVSTLLDSAPIDISISSNRVTKLVEAIGYQENLLVFGDNAQFVLRGGDLLTPKTVSVTPVTNFSFDSSITPTVLGSYVYFPFTRGAFSGMREYSVNASTESYDAAEITEHVPAYIPKNIVDTAGTTAENVIAVLSGDEKNALYLYNYFWSNNQKVLSAWSKFTFDGEIRGIEFIDSSLYMVLTKEGETHVVGLPMESGLTDTDHNDAASPFLTLLDNRVRAKMTSGSTLIEFEQSNGSYSSANADLPYHFYDGTLPVDLEQVFVDSDGVTHELEYKNTNGSQVHLKAGNATSTLYGYVGNPYTMKYKFSTQVFKGQTQKGASPTASSAMTVRNGAVFFDETHCFTVKVTPEGRTTNDNDFVAADRPDSEQLGAIKFAEGFFRFPIHSKAKHAEIVIENDSPFDSKFSSAEFESFVHPRSKRYG